MTPGLGHNGGPDLDGRSWRLHAWGRAREALLPTLPVEVVRLRVRRAAELGLPYRTYAGIRAASGRDVIGFLFSSNALRLLREGAPLPRDVAEGLGRLRGADRIAALHRPLAVAAEPPLDHALRAPRPFAPWPELAATLGGTLDARRLPRDGVVVVGAAPFERDWAEAARAAWYLTGERYFGGA